LNYYNFANLLSKIGGYKAALTPIWNLFTPLLIIGFLIQLARIIRDNYKESYTMELGSSLKYYSQFLEVQP
jgi:hypothetical protein